MSLRGFVICFMHFYANRVAKVLNFIPIPAINPYRTNVENRVSS